MRFVPVPHDALDALDTSDWVAVVDLYKRSHAMRWAPIQVTERGLASRWGVSSRRVWVILETLEAGQFLTLKRGTNRKPSVIRVVCPTLEEVENEPEKVKHSGQRKRQHNLFGETPGIAEAEAQSVAQNGETLLRPENKTREEQANFAAALAVWNDEVRSAFDQPMRIPAKLKPTKGQGVHLAALLKAESLPDVLEVFRWIATAQDHGLNGGAAFHRSQRTKIETIRRKFDDYLDKARNPFDSQKGSSQANGDALLKAEADLAWTHVGKLLRDRDLPERLHPNDDRKHEAAMAGIEACGGVDDLRRSRDDFADRRAFVAGYLERRTNP